MIQAAEHRQPEVAFPAGGSVKTVPAAAAFDASSGARGQSAGQGECLFDEVGRAVRAEEELAFIERHAVELLGVHPVRDDAHGGGQALDRGPCGTFVRG